MTLSPDGLFQPDQIHSWLRGPMVAVATPFHEDYSLNLDGLRSNIRLMTSRGVVTGAGSLLVAGACSYLAFAAAGITITNVVSIAILLFVAMWNVPGNRRRSCRAGSRCRRESGGR